MAQTRTRSKKETAESNGHDPQATPGQIGLDGHEVPADPQPPVEEIVVNGPHPLSLFNAGGKKPNTASLRFIGGKAGLMPGTGFKKGDVIKFSGVATVVDVTQRDKRDRQTRIVIECEQQHRAEIDDLTVQPLDPAA